MLSTTELANATDVAPDMLLRMLDAGLFRDAARLSRGRPMYSPEAVEVVRHASELADQVATSQITPAEAWFLLRYGLKPEPA
jgi:hypothetical protein